MTTIDDKAVRFLRIALRTLQITVVLQCLGNWRWLTAIGETPLLHWMLNPTDIGGLAWSESTALFVQQCVAWMLILAALVILWRPHPIVLIPVFLFQLLTTIAMWQLSEGYSVQATWLPVQMLQLFPFATQLARIFAPLGLMLLYRQSSNWPESQKQIARTVQMLRWAVAIVFIAHGIEAWQGNPKFVDLLIIFCQNWLGIALKESTAVLILKTISIVDIIVAVVSVSTRFLPVIWWIAFWGGITALSRVAAYGWAMAGHEFLTRIPHLGLPLTVALWWHLIRWNTHNTTRATPKQTTE